MTGKSIQAEILLTDIDSDEITQELKRLFGESKHPLGAAAEASLLMDEGEALVKALAEGQCFLTASIELSESRTAILSINPHYFVKGSWRPYARPPFGYLLSEGKYGGQSSTMQHKQCIPETVYRVWLSQMKFCDPVRSLNKGAANAHSDDGSMLIGELNKRSRDVNQSVPFHRLKIKILELVNSLMVPTGSSRVTDFNIKDNSGRLALEITTDDLPVSIEQMGTGISEIFMTCCWLAINGQASGQFFLEEPETHLHPALLRRYLSLLSSHKNIQFMINTHSNVLLNSLNESSSVWLFQRTHPTGTSAVLCKEFSKLHRTLDALGINGASLLQSNCVVWVEGPSDRIYIRNWLNDFAFSIQKERLVEDSDYSFVLYGGKLLSHYSFNDAIDPDEEGSASQAIQMLRVSRFSAVLMDKDVPAGQENKIRAVKVSIEKSSNEKHRRAFFTDGREIENDVQQKALARALETVLRLNQGSLSALRATGKKSFVDETIDHLRLEPNESKKLKQRLNGLKVEIAEQASARELSDGEPEFPSYISKLYNFIVSSRVESQSSHVDVDVDIS